MTYLGRPGSEQQVFLLGLDVGSTTVKGVRMTRGTLGPASFRYERHHGDLMGTARRILGELLQPEDRVRPFVTGSGGALLAERLGAPVVHEVSAVTAAVRRLHPGAGTIIELGGQDAKLVLLERGADGQIRVHAGMNDRCAAGTGVTIDRCLLRLGIGTEEARQVVFNPECVRALSTKCGVFAETDLVNLARAGVAPDVLVASLADAIVVGNLAVLARGITPLPTVVLLGGPHATLPALAAAWRHHLGRLWRERGFRDVAGDAVAVPDQAVLYAAIGACEVGMLRGDGDVCTAAAMVGAIERRAPRVVAREDVPLATSAREAQASLSDAADLRTSWPLRGAGDRVAIGVDAGSTVSKAVALDSSGRILARASRRSGDPVTDAGALLADVEIALAARGGARADALGVTGYASAVVAAVLGADVEIVETVAHARSARAAVPTADVVCDVGGQDIKVMVLDRAGAIRDFRISTQCSAGIGLVLEATARELGVALEDFANRALAARRAPYFAESCVVFLDSNRVTAQRQGYAPDEILAGLARALPRVIWGDMMRGTPPATLGRTFVLQGGVQHNLAAVKAQADFLQAEVPGAVVQVHPHPADAGAIGAALHALDSAAARSREPAKRRRALEIVSTRSDESTRCGLCENRCPRTLVDGRDLDGAARTWVAGHACDAGATPALRSAAAIPRRRAREIPNLLAEEERQLFARTQPVQVLRQPQRRVRVGIPRVLAMYRAAPFFAGYLRSLGVAPRDVVFSPRTTDALWREGAQHGASDPCFPVKVTLAHVHHLLHEVHDRGRALDAVFVPRMTHAAVPVRHVVDCASCPVVAASPALVRAAFVMTDDAFASRGVRLLDPTITITDGVLLRAQMHAAFGDLLGVTRAESDAGVAEGFAAMRALDDRLQRRARGVLTALEVDRARGRPRRGAVLVLCRPYHADPGISHRLGEELQALGYPVLTIRSLPRDPAYLEELCRAELAAGVIEDPFDVRDLLPEVDNSGSAERLWGARLAAAHGGLGVVDVSSFKCAQDATTHVPIRTLLDGAGVVTCALHDLDETRPVTSIRLRLRTFAHALRERGVHAWSS